MGKSHVFGWRHDLGMTLASACTLFGMKGLFKRLERPGVQSRECLFGVFDPERFASRIGEGVFFHCCFVSWPADPGFALAPWTSKKRFEVS